MHTYKDDGRSRQVKQIWPIYTENLPLEGPCIIFCNIYTFQRDTQCSSTDGLLMLRCQLYMFRTVTLHPQELLFRCCMCRLWYVVRTALSDTSRWYNVWGRTISAATLCISLECIYIAYTEKLQNIFPSSFYSHVAPTIFKTWMYFHTCKPGVHKFWTNTVCLVAPNTRILRIWFLH